MSLLSTRASGQDTDVRVTILVRILWTAGRPKLAINEARELSAMGHDVTVVFLRKSARVAGYSDLLAGVNHVVLTENNRSPLTPLYDYITGLFSPDRKGDGRIDYNLIREFPAYLRSHGADLLICHDQWAGLSGYYAKKKLGTPYVVYIDERLSTFRGVLGSVANRIEKRTLREALRVFAINPKVAVSVEQKCGVHAIVDMPGFAPAHLEDYSRKRNALIAVTMWDIGRKPSVYLDVMESLPGYELWMVGNWRDRGFRDTFLPEVSRRRLTDRVQLISGVTEAELDTLYQQAKFFIRFGFGEYGSPVGISEAIERGLPGIVNDDLGNAGLIRDAGAGLVMSQIDANSVRNYIEENDNPTRYPLLQQKVVSLAGRFSWRDHAAGLVA